MFCKIFLVGLWPNYADYDQGFYLFDRGLFKFLVFKRLCTSKSIVGEIAETDCSPTKFRFSTFDVKQYILHALKRRDKYFNFNLTQD